MIILTLILLLAGTLLARVAQPQTDTPSALTSYPIGNSVPLLRTIHPRTSARRLATRVTRSGSYLYTNEVSFAVEVEVSGQKMYAQIDTTSCDTWFIKPTFICRTESDDPAPAADCNYSRPFDPNGSDFELIPGQVFNNSWVENDQGAVGIVGTVPITIAGFDIQSQEIGLIDSARWYGDGISSGVIGLAHSELTSAFQSFSPRYVASCFKGMTFANSGCNQIRYSSLVNTMFNVENLTDSIFALALSRDESGSHGGGILTFGGVPDPSGPQVNVTDVNRSAFVSVKIPPTTGGLSVYEFDVDGIVFPGSDQIAASNATAAGAGTYIIETEYLVNYFPRSVADAINAAFSPPAWIDSSTGEYRVLCDTSLDNVPSVGVTIGGVTLYMNAKDMIVHHTDGTCVSSIQAQDGALWTNPAVLGDKFLNNVLVAFVWGRNGVFLWSRLEYQS